MSRLTPQQLESMQRSFLEHPLTNYESGLLLSEIAELRRERDEAIVGAYRAAAEIAHKHAEHRQPYDKDYSMDELDASAKTAAFIVDEIEALLPQSALDAVERDRREIAETAMRMWDECLTDKRPAPTADDVLAKVKRA